MKFLSNVHIYIFKLNFAYIALSLFSAYFFSANTMNAQSPELVERLDSITGQKINIKSGSILYYPLSDFSVELISSQLMEPCKVVAPPDIVVSCSHPIDTTQLTNVKDPSFGRIVTDISTRKKVVTNDIVCNKFCEANTKSKYPGFVKSNQVPKSAPNQACDYYNSYFDTAHNNRKYELVWGFDGYVSECIDTPIITINDLRTCGQGRIERVISALDSDNETIRDTQTIWIVDCDPFFSDSLHCNDSLYSDIIWPDEVCTGKVVSIYGCRELNNPVLRGPRIIHRSNSNCSSVAFEYRDQFIINAPISCLRLVRTWIVIDWCQYDPFLDPKKGKWEGSQIIDIYDTTKPNIKINLGKQDLPNANGLAFIIIDQEATDDCLVNKFIPVEYKIDEFNDGIGKYPGGFEHKVGPLSLIEFNSGSLPLFADNIRALNPNNPLSASGSYPIGVHKIIWTANDGCGNTSSKEEIFEIKKTVDVKDFIDSDKEFNLTPNPTNGNVTVKLFNEIDRLELISTLGANNKTYTVKGKQSIEINSISSGVYFIQAFRNGKSVGTKKLIVIN